MAEAAPNSIASPADLLGAGTTVPAAEQRIAQMEDSMRCFVHGWLTLLPLAGTFFVYPAVSFFRRVERQGVGANPAYHHHLWGLLLASFGYWTNLVWWGLFTIWIGSISDALGHNDFEQGVPFIALGYVLSLGSAPAVFGLGCVAARWPNRFGTLVHRWRWVLLGLAAAGYAVLVQVLGLQQWPFRGPRLDSADEFRLWFYAMIAIWLTWLVGGFVCLAWRGARLRWWLAWLAVAAALSLCVVA